MFYQVSIFRTKPRKKSTHHGGVEWGGRADGVGALLGSLLQMKRGSCIWGRGASGGPESHDLMWEALRLKRY